MYLAGARATASPGAASVRFGAALEEFATSNVEAAGGLTLNFTDAANCAVVRTEIVQHGSDPQFDAPTAEFDEALQDKFLEWIAESSDIIPRIELPLEGGQQSAEE